MLSILSHFNSPIREIEHLGKDLLPSLNIITRTISCRLCVFFSYYMQAAHFCSFKFLINA